MASRCRLEQRFAFASHAAHHHHHRLRRRPVLEVLEGRALLATFTVNSLGDAGTSSSSNAGDLRYCINQANANNEANTIVFDSSVFSTPQTITLSVGTLELSDTGGLQTITGPAAGLTIYGLRTASVFQVDKGVTASISGLTISHRPSSYEKGDARGLVNFGTVTLTGCTISGNTAGAGGPGYGGGLDNEFGTANLIGCTISGNSAVTYGGGVFNLGTASLTGCTISGNSAYLGRGGGLDNWATAYLTDCTISGNSAHSLGGGLDDASTAYLTNCTISGNSAAENGGGLYVWGGKSTTLTDSIVAGNTTGNGAPSDIDGAGNASGGFNLIGTGGSGGLNIFGSNIVLTSLTTLRLAPLGDYGGPTQTMPLLPGSVAIGNGIATSGVTTDQRGFPLDSPTADIGAFQTQPSGALVVGVIGDAGAPPGELDLRGAVNLANVLEGAQTITFKPTAFSTANTISLAAGQLELSDTSGKETISGPAAGVTVSGGGNSRVFQVDADVTASISGVTITGGSTSGFGGGVYADDAALNLTDCTISGNSAGFGGGLLMNKGSASLSGCTMSGNTASVKGGALDNYGGAATIEDCTIAGNTAGAGGGGIFAGLNHSQPPTTTLIETTIADNSTDSGVGGLHNEGVATLIDTIVASNTTGSPSTPSDIGGPAASGVTGSYNLIGIGGSGGITGGGSHNIVLTSLGGLNLGSLGDYGGPTETMPLLPGSPAIGKGVIANDPGTAAPITSDQRDEPLDTPNPDIGAFQSQGFKLTAAAGSTPQSTAIGTAFANALAVTVAAKNPVEPVAGGVLTFTAPASGASANVSATTVTIGSSGVASVTATANATDGSYTVTASAGVAATADFDLDNVVPLTFSGISNQTITYGASSVIISGTLTGGSQALVGESVAVTLDSAEQSAQIGSSGSFSATFTFDSSGPSVSHSPYTVNYAYKSDGTFASESTTSKLTVDPATLTIKAIPETKVYGTADPTLAYTPNGFEYSDTAATVLTGVLARAQAGTLAGEQAGSYTIGQGTLAASSNYTISFTGSTLTITPAPLSVTANSQTKVYGTSDPSLTDGGTGLVDTTVDGVTIVDTAATVLTGQLSRAQSGTVAGEQVGSYSIAQGTLAADSDYTLSFTGNLLTVMPAALTVTVNSASRLFGQANPTFTASYSGFVNGDTPTSLSALPHLSTTAARSSPVGTYAITASGAVDPNYTINYVAGKLTVNPALAIVTSVEVENVKSGNKTREVIVIQFSEALSATAAQKLGNYSLVTIPKSKGQTGKKASLSSAAYSPTALTVTLSTSQPLTLSSPVDLTITAAGLLDALGRPLAANYSATLSKVGVSVTPSVPQARVGALSADAVAAVLAAGLRRGC